KGVDISGLNDSKQLSESKRKILRQEIEEKCIWCVASLPPLEIDKINILNASIRSMQLALDGLKTEFQHILIDGNRFKPYKEVPFTTVVKGDGKYKSIAAASILAKTHRDEYMENLAKEFPQYHWEINKGYPTESHRNAIKQYGSNIHHRKSFTLLPTQLELWS
ncbi:MAG: ribonuclease HII, partial [Bacteroidetes bacterium]|nr:ribonuclease HII [Bacteroidota bacterium]